MATEPITLVPGLAPAAPIMRLLSQFDRAKIEAFAEISIALLDLQDGDPDLEDNADAEQASWPNHAMQLGLGKHCMAWDHDDAEDDDPAGGDVCDGPHDPEGDYDYPGHIPGGGSEETRC